MIHIQNVKELNLFTIHKEVLCLILLAYKLFRKESTIRDERTPQQSPSNSSETIKTLLILLRLYKGFNIKTHSCIIVWANPIFGQRASKYPTN